MSQRSAISPDGVQVISRSFMILRAVADSGTGSKLGELAKQVELPRPTVHRIAQSLQDEGVLFLTPDGRVQIGPELRRLAITSQRTLTESAAPFMQQLAGEVSETVDLAVLEQGSIRFIAHVPSQQRLRAGSVLGDRFPAYCTAPGKALLSALTPRAAKAALPDRLTKFTSNTITSRENLFRELDEVRHSGVAFDREEHTEMICAVSALIRDGIGPLAALAIAAPADRFRKHETEFREAVLRTAQELDGLLGG